MPRPTRAQKARATLSTQPGLSVLGDAKTEVLLRAFATLTHKIHATRDAPLTCAREKGWYEEDLRNQRDLIRDEILRRTGDL